MGLVGYLGAALSAMCRCWVWACLSQEAERNDEHKIWTFLQLYQSRLTGSHTDRQKDRQANSEPGS